MAENIKLIGGQQVNFTVDQGYFYTFDHSQDNLLVKTDDGNTAFSYPFDTLLTNTVISAEFDGVYFWSLEDSGVNDMDIKRWKIDNYVCKLQQTISLTETGSHKYQSAAFSVAHYHTSFSSVSSSGTSTINMNDYTTDSTLMGFTTTAGQPLTLHLGPNTNGEEEDVLVNTASSGVVTISGTTQYDYAENDEINFYTNIWLFNDWDGLSSATGALYKIDAYTGAYVTRYASGAYKAVGAATFYNVDSFAAYGDVDTLAYVKGTNMLFVNVGVAGVTLSYYGSMVMENIKDDEATVIALYDLAMDDQNVYRLQLIADGAGGAWSYYSYELSSLDSFITSISLAAYPAILAANGIATAGITAIVKDQFLQPITGRLVTFTDDSATGDITGSNPVNTNSQGKSSTVYTSGTAAEEVKITATAEQT